MIIEKRRGKPVYFAEVSDFQYFNTLSAEAQVELKEHLEDKLEKFYKQKRYIAMCIAKGETPDEW